MDFSGIPCWNHGSYDFGSFSLVGPPDDWIKARAEGDACALHGSHLILIFYFILFYFFWWFSFSFFCLFVFWFLNFKIFNSYMRSQTWTPLPPPSPLYFKLNSFPVLSAPSKLTALAWLPSCVSQSVPPGIILVTHSLVTWFFFPYPWMCTHPLLTLHLPSSCTWTDLTAKRGVPFMGQTLDRELRVQRECNLMPPRVLFSFVSCPSYLTLCNPVDLCP